MKQGWVGSASGGSPSQTRRPLPGTRSSALPSAGMFSDAGVRVASNPGACVSPARSKRSEGRASASSVSVARHNALSLPPVKRRRRSRSRLWPARRTFRLSPSRASDYQQCPLLYRLRAIDRLPEPKTLPQVKGNLVHAVLEYMHAQPRPERTYPAAVKQLKPHWAAMVEADAELSELVPETDLYDFLVDCRTLLRGYFEMENPQGFDAHAVEMYVDTVLPNGVPVRGFIDRVDVAPTGQVRVVDYKTGRAPGAGFEGKALFQMRFYGLVIWRRTGRVPDLLQLVYLGDGTIIRYEPDEADLLGLERNVRAVWAAIEQAVTTRDFRPNPSRLCGWCDFKPLCPAFGGTPPELPETIEIITPEATPGDDQDSASP